MPSFLVDQAAKPEGLTVIIIWPMVRAVDPELDAAVAAEKRRCKSEILTNFEKDVKLLPLSLKII